MIAQVLLLLLLLVPAARADVARLRPEFDTSALEIFWGVVEALQAGRPADESQWDALFQTPAYLALCADEFSPIELRQYLEIAAMPSRRAEADAIERTDRRMGPTVAHFREVLRRRAEVERAVRRMVERSLDDSLLRSVRELLPERIADERPRIAFAVFQNDGRGYEPIVIDPLALVRWDVPPFLAHEIHHWFHKRLQRVEVDRVPVHDRELVRALVTLHFEGVADLIDKHAWVLDPSRAEPFRRPYVDMYRQQLVRSASTLAELDRELAAWIDARDAGERGRAGHDLRHLLPMGGHPTGYVLARAILDGSGRPALVSTAGNPFAFVRAADAAGPKLDPPLKVLGERARAALDRLESLYLHQARGNRR